MNSLIEEHKKYRWFYTSSDKLVIGGKSASQNEELLKRIKSLKSEFFIMHTSEPGSPFSILLSPVDKVKKSDLEETAIFTGCFSRAWRSGKKKTKVDIFLASKLFKSKSMKEGTWGVSDKLDSQEVELKLGFTEQDKILRAVPILTLGTKKPLLIVYPGKTDKAKLVNEIKSKLKNKFSDEQILASLPAGGVQI